MKTSSQKVSAIRWLWERMTASKWRIFFGTLVCFFILFEKYQQNYVTIEFDIAFSESLPDLSYGTFAYQKEDDHSAKARKVYYSKNQGTEFQHYKVLLRTAASFDKLTWQPVNTETSVSLKNLSITKHRQHKIDLSSLKTQGKTQELVYRDDVLSFDQSRDAQLFFQDDAASYLLPDLLDILLYLLLSITITITVLFSIDWSVGLFSKYRNYSMLFGLYWGCVAILGGWLWFYLFEFKIQFEIQAPGKEIRQEILVDYQPLGKKDTERFQTKYQHSEGNTSLVSVPLGANGAIKRISFFPFQNTSSVIIKNIYIQKLWTTSLDTIDPHDNQLFFPEKGLSSVKYSGEDIYLASERESASVIFAKNAYEWLTPTVWDYLGILGLAIGITGVFFFILHSLKLKLRYQSYQDRIQSEHQYFGQLRILPVDERLRQMERIYTHQNLCRSLFQEGCQHQKRGNLEAARQAFHDVLYNALLSVLLVRKLPSKLEHLTIPEFVVHPDFAELPVHLQTAFIKLTQQATSTSQVSICWKQLSYLMDDLDAEKTLSQSLPWIRRPLLWRKVAFGCITLLFLSLGIAYFSYVQHTEASFYDSELFFHWTDLASEEDAHKSYDIEASNEWKTYHVSLKHTIMITEFLLRPVTEHWDQVSLDWVKLYDEKGELIRKLSFADPKRWLIERSDRDVEESKYFSFSRYKDDPLLRTKPFDVSHVRTFELRAKYSHEVPVSEKLSFYEWLDRESRLLFQEERK